LRGSRSRSKEAKRVKRQDIDYFRDLLTNQLEELLSQADDRHDRVSPVRAVREAIAAYREKAIQDALERIENGTFGICKKCGGDISFEHIQAEPLTLRCADCGAEHTGNLSCSFCGKSEEKAKKLIAGPRVYICDECQSEVTTKKMLKGLTDSEKKVLRARFGIDFDKVDLEDSRVTRERIREIEAKALREIRKLRDDPPDDIA